MLPWRWSDPFYPYKIIGLHQTVNKNHTFTLKQRTISLMHSSILREILWRLIFFFKLFTISTFSKWTSLKRQTILKCVPGASKLEWHNICLYIVQNALKCSHQFEFIDLYMHGIYICTNNFYTNLIHMLSYTALLTPPPNKSELLRTSQTYPKKLVQYLSQELPEL
jgi:hypothetical protein